MKVYIEKDDRSVDVNKKSISGIELLKFLKINPSSIILVKNDEVVLDDEIFTETDKIKILSVVSGG
jgi:sulfur carrier protein ThiS